MHVLGKVLAFFVVIAAIVAAVFTSKLVAVRNSWTGKVIASRNAVTAKLAEIDKLEAQIDSLKSELFRSQDLWGVFWSGVPTAVNADDGNLVISIGANNLIRQDMALHGFEIAADGSSIYRGSFSPTEVRETSAALKPNWRATPDDIATWQAGNWRWRNTLPPGYQDNFDNQSLGILKLTETLADRTQTLLGQGELLEQANNGLKQRDAELVGGEMLERSESVDPEFRDGLVSAVENAEEARNQVLLKVDGLRRKVREVQADIERIQAENEALIGRLPGAGSSNSLTQNQ